MVVVLPVPLTPQTRTTCGRNRARCGKGCRHRLELLGHGRRQRLTHLDVADFLAEPPLGHGLYQHGRGLDAEIGHDQRLLELFEGGGIEPPLGDGTGDLLGEAAGGARQPGLEPREPA